MDPNFSPNGGSGQVSIRTHIIEFIQTLVVFAAIGTAVYLFIAQPHKVSGSSMYPNFKNNDYIITNKIGYDFEKPQRGQVIVFKNPKDLSQDFIKRIIGLPGEKVKIQDGHVFINDQQLPEPYLPDGLQTMAGAFAQEGQEIDIPPDNYFVLGDNRPASSDSREWGFVTRQEIIGQAFFRYWPENEIGIIHPAHYPANI